MGRLEKRLRKNGRSPVAPMIQERGEADRKEELENRKARKQRAERGKKCSNTAHCLYPAPAINPQSGSRPYSHTLTHTGTHIYTHTQHSAWLPTLLRRNESRHGMAERSMAFVRGCAPHCSDMLAKCFVLCVCLCVYVCVHVFIFWIYAIVTRGLALSCMYNIKYTVCTKLKARLSWKMKYSNSLIKQCRMGARQPFSL